MKRSLHIPFTLLILIALFSLFLTFRIIPLRRNPAGTLILNETLIHLAAADPEAPHLLNDIHNILAGNLPATSRPHVRTRSVLRHPVQPPNPNLRPLLLSWFNHRHFQASIMSDLLSLIKTPIDHTNRPYPSCAVVGNSGILLQHNHGPIIDTHAMVIRLNNARINGYQANVGSKTTLSFVNSNILHLCARRSGCSCHPYGDTIPMIMYICQAAHFVDYLGCNATHKAPLLVTDPRFDLLCARIVKYYSLKRFVDETGRAVEEWGNFHDERMFHYSSGMQAVVMALGICDRVSVFGFGKSGEAKHHYHTNQKAELDLHDYEAEYVFYRDLVERPEAIPFLEGSGFKVPPVVFYH